MSVIDDYRARFGTGTATRTPSVIDRYRARNQTTPTRIDGAFTPRVSSKDLKTSSGLYNLAAQSGLKWKADRILAGQQGEETKKFFSGGFISDTFDVLNALDYGVVGLLKGKSFREGVRTRQSFSDQDALGKFGLRGVIAGTVLDIAVDPLTYAGSLGILSKVSKISGLTKLAKAGKALTFGRMAAKSIKTAEGVEKTYQAIEGGTKLGKYLGSKFTWMFGADPIFREAFERSVKNIAVTTQAVSKLGKSVAELAPETAAKLLTKDATGRNVRVLFEQLPRELQLNKSVRALYDYVDNLGKEATDLGLLSSGVYEKNLGTYIKNAYEEYELANKKGLFGFARAGIKGIKKRVAGNVDEFGLTQIENPAYLLFKSAFDLTKDVENAKLFKTVAEKFGTDVAQEGFKKLPTGIRLGQAAGKYVPENVALYLTDIIEPAKNTLVKAAVANFKFFKVIMNPGTHARNIVSNKILNYWKLGMNPLDPRVIKSDTLAAREILRGVGKWSDEARPLGYNLDTFASAEMKGLLDSPEAASWGRKAGKAWPTVKKKLGDLYQAEENHAKLSAYIFNRTSRKLSPEDAWKAAESATFNYAQVTPFVRKLRESLFGFPFITFTVKSTPVVAETILKNPQRVSVIGKIKQSIENLSDTNETDRERQSEPPWVKNGFFIKLPMKDKEGRSAYFDLTYILPFGDLMSGNFFEGGTDRESGLPESKATTLAKKSPFISLVMELGKNQDFYGNKIWRSSDSSYKQTQDLMRHITKTYAPPLVGDLLPGGYNDRGERQTRGIIESFRPNTEPDQKRTTMQELLRMVGAKIQPIDADIQETYQEWNKQKALRSLLLENGALKEFNSVYIPKD